MSYSLDIDKGASNFLDKLPKHISLRIIDKLEKLKDDPFRYLEHYEGDYYKLRIGDYRALIDIAFERKMIFVRILDKRGRIYKR